MSVTPDLYLIVAESSLEAACYEDCAAAVDCFLRQQQGDEPNGLARAYICRASVLAELATCAADMDKAAEAALVALQHALDAGAEHSHLVYNVSVVYWRTVQRFLCPGSWQQLLPGLQDVVDALSKVAEPDVAWRGELGLVVAKAQQAAGKSAASKAAIETVFKASANTPDDVLDHLAQYYLTLELPPGMLKKFSRPFASVRNLVIAVHELGAKYVERRIILLLMCITRTD